MPISKTCLFLVICKYHTKIRKTTHFFVPTILSGLHFNSQDKSMMRRAFTNNSNCNYIIDIKK